MKANELAIRDFKKYGIEGARKEIKDTGAIMERLKPEHLEYIECLKSLVESHEIINRACGSDRVIDLHNRYKSNPIAHKYWLGVRVERMSQAIVDLESCQ